MSSLQAQGAPTTMIAVCGGRFCSHHERHEPLNICSPQLLALESRLYSMLYLTVGSSTNLWALVLNERCRPQIISCPLLACEVCLRDAESVGYLSIQNTSLHRCCYWDSISLKEDYRRWCFVPIGSGMEAGAWSSSWRPYRRRWQCKTEHRYEKWCRCCLVQGWPYLSLGFCSRILNIS